MKYYSNIFKRKKWGILIVIILLAALGSWCLYANLIDYISSGVEPNSSFNPAVSGSPATTALSASNVGMIVVGVIIIWTALIFIPFNSPYLQDDEDYKFEFEENNIHIWFKNNEWVLDKKKLSPTNFFFKDKNNKFVSITRGYQVYNYYRYKIRNK